ncbi:MAG: iron-sulfur cluster assembly protein [bacterium]
MAEENIEQALKKIRHPEIDHTLFDLGMIKDVSVKENKKIELTLQVPFIGVPIKDYLIDTIKSAVKNEDEEAEVEVSVKQMSEEERARFMQMAQEAWIG